MGEMYYFSLCIYSCVRIVIVRTLPSSSQAIHIYCTPCNVVIVLRTTSGYIKE